MSPRTSRSTHGETRASLAAVAGTLSKLGALSVKYEHLERSAYDSVRAARADIAQNLKWYNSEPADSRFDDATPAQHDIKSLPMPKQAAKDEVSGAPRLPTASVGCRERRPLPWTTPAPSPTRSDEMGNLSKRAGPSLPGGPAGGARADGGGKQLRPQRNVLRGAMSLAIFLDCPHR